MSEFLLVIPEGWTQLDWQFITNNIADMGQGNVLNWLNSNEFSYIEAGLKEHGIIAPDATLVGVKLIDDTYFLIKLG